MFIEALLVGVLVWKFFSDWQHKREMSNLLDRFMSRNFDEYKYFEKKFPKDINIATKLQEGVLTEQAIDEKEEEHVKKFVSELEEDWGTDAIDKKRVPEIENESKINRVEDSQE